MPLRRSSVILTDGGAAASFSNSFSMLHDGVNEYINVPHSSSLNFSITTNFSLSMWIKRTAISGAFEVMISKNTGLTGYWIMIRSVNVLSFSTGNNNIVIDSTTLIDSTTSWYNVICTYDGSQNANGMNWYVNNGAAERNINVNNPPGAIETTEPLKIGIWNDNSFPFNGNQDEISIWNKELTVDDRTSIWNGGSPGNLSVHPSNASLVLWSRGGDGATFNGTNWSIPDDSGNDNTGTSVNMEQADRVSDIPG